MLRGSLLLAAIYFGLVLHWVVLALWGFSALALAAFLMAWLLLVSMIAGAGWLVHRSVHRLRVPIWLALPVIWTAAEWFRAHWPGAMAFPWLGLGTSLTGTPELVGIAEWTGARGVTFWLVAVNALLADLIHRAGTDRPRRRLIVGLLVTAIAPALLGVWRVSTLEMRPAARIASIQTNVPQLVKSDPDRVFDSTFAALDRLLPSLADTAVDLIVLPEVTFPVDLTHPDGLVVVAGLTQRSASAGAPILFGALGSGPDGFGVTNSVFLVSEGGLQTFRYDKMRLVPGIERVPFLPERWVTRLGRFGGYRAGQEVELVPVASSSLGVLICYESAFEDLSRRARRSGADALVNVSNDGWYGREPAWARTTGLWQHPAHLVMRAIETRTGVTRTANTGFSMFIDPAGRRSSGTRVLEEATRIDTVWTTDGTTLYVRLGDWVGGGCAFAALLLLFAARRRTSGWRSLDPSGQEV